MKWLRSNLFIYILAPSTISLLLMAMFFSGNDTLQSIIVPTMPELDSNSWREFGLLENIQHLYIVLIFIFCLHAIKLKARRIEKTAAAFMAIFALFILLEEIDYGLHYYEWAYGIPSEERIETRNLHNSSKEVLQNIRRTVDIGMALFFLVLPLIADRIHSPMVRYLAPNRWLLGTALCIIALSEVSHSWDDYFLALHDGAQHKLHKNISEFREVSVYYIFLLYFWELVYRKKWSTTQTPLPSRAKEPIS